MANAATDRQILGHPIGLYTLFFTELWERFSYYGMRALLILFMTDTVAHGMGMTERDAGAIYGLYTFGVYALALPGGWIADRLLGQRRAVLHGGVLIALGHYCLAVPSTVMFYAGLVLIVLGTGLLKPNVSAIVGDLYAEKGAKRDAGFSIFYMGINIGAFLGPIVCSFLGEPREGVTWVNWHYGFGAAGVGMTLALVAYVLGQKNLRGAGELKEDSADPARIAQARKAFGIGLVVCAAIVVAVVVAMRGGMFTLHDFAGYTGIVVVALAGVYFAAIILFVCRDATERRRVGLCAVLFVGAALFWSGFEQAGSSMNIFTRDFTNRMVGDTEIAAGTLQAINPLFIIILAPFMGMLWVALGRFNPSIPLKFGFGLVLLGVGFLVMSWGSADAVEGSVGMRWLIVTYFFHTVGELCLSPVGLSSVTKLSPDRLVGQMMGTWFMGAALGNLIAGLAAGFIEDLPMSELFGTVATIVIVAGIVYVVLAKPLNWLSAGIK